MALREGVTSICSFGKELLELFAGGGDIDVDAEIETARALQFIPDKQGDFAGREAVDENLGGSDDQSIGNRGIGDRDAFEPLGGIDEQRLPDHDAKRRRGGVLGGVDGGGCLAAGLEWCPGWLRLQARLRSRGARRQNWKAETTRR